MSTTAGASSYRWRTPAQESTRKSTSGYSIHWSLQNRAVWGWVCRSAVRSLRPMVAGCGLPRTNRRAPSFSLCCSPTVRRLVVLHDESNSTTSCLVLASDADEIIDILRLDRCLVVHARLPSSEFMSRRLGSILGGLDAALL